MMSCPVSVIADQYLPYVITTLRLSDTLQAVVYVDDIIMLDLLYKIKCSVRFAMLVLLFL
jgi:hypothetical protein